MEYLQDKSIFKEVFLSIIGNREIVHTSIRLSGNKYNIVIIQK